jgi:hypothetical protein
LNCISAEKWVGGGGGGSFDVIEATELKSGVFGSFILVALMPVGFVNCFF